MNLKTRRIVYIIFILIFIFSAPAIIFYALGYKYNWSKKTLEKTGVFFIKSYPKNSDIYINDKEFKDKTPTLVNRLLPNFYKIKVTKDGYLDWQKNLPINPQITTFIEDISLFKKQLDFELISPEEFSNFLQSKNKIYVILSQNNRTTSSLWLYNTLNDEVIKFYQSDSPMPFELISWTNNSQKVLIKKGNFYYTLNINQKNKLNSIEDVTALPFSKLIWDTYNNNILYGIYQQKLYQVNLLDNETELLTPGSVLAAVNYETDVIAIVKEQDKYYLKFIKSEKEPLLSLPYSDYYNLENPGFGFITLFDKSQKTLYLLEPKNSDQPVKTVFKNIENFKWHDDQFLFWNNNELWVYYPDVNQKALVERTSQPIVSALWHPNVVYVYGQTADELKVYELDGRDHRNNYSLFNFESSDNNLVFTNKKGDYLYLITLIDGQNGLYKVNIQ